MRSDAARAVDEKPPNVDVERVMMAMLDYMWTADTNRRMAALRQKFGVHKSANVQTTTRGGVAKSSKKEKK